MEANKNKEEKQVLEQALQIATIKNKELESQIHKLAQKNLMLKNKKEHDHSFPENKNTDQKKKTESTPSR